MPSSDDSSASSSSSSSFVLAAPVARNRLLRPHLCAMRVFGYALFDHQRARFAHNARGIVLSVLFAVFNVTQYVDLFGTLGRFDQMTTNASTTLLFTTTVLRMGLFYGRRGAWTNAIRRVHADTERTRLDGSAGDRTIANRYVRYVNALTTVFWLSAQVTANLMCIATLVRLCLTRAADYPLDAPMILRSWFPFDVRRSAGSAFAAYAIQLAVMWMGMIIVPSWNTLMVALMTNAIVGLRQLNGRLREPLLTTGASADAYRRLTECAVRLRRLRRDVRKLERLMRPFIFLDFLAFSVLLCALLYQASRAPLGVQLAINVCYMFTMISILWMYYWHANEIMVWSDKLTASLYARNWYEENAAYRKAVQIFMLSTQRPITMKTVFLELNLNNFISILRASYSYFTLLKQLDS